MQKFAKPSGYKIVLPRLDLMLKYFHDCIVYNSCSDVVKVSKSTNIAAASNR